MQKMSFFLDDNLSFLTTSFIRIQQPNNPVGDVSNLLKYYDEWDNTQSKNMMIMLWYLSSVPNNMPSCCPLDPDQDDEMELLITIQSS